MKLRLTCMKCLQENGIPNLRSINVDINDTGIYQTKCDRGHDIAAVLQNLKFELLFDLGTLALIDGHTRESVSSLASSLERFLEFCIELISVSNEINREEYNCTWKYIRNSSERQLGAFYFLYLQHFNKSAEQIDSNWVGFRNSVIHKGKIPEYGDVLDYGEYILQYIFSILKEFRENDEDVIQNIISYKLIEKNKKIKTNNISTMHIPTTISVVSGEKDYREKSFKKAIKEMKRKDFVYTNESDLYTNIANINLNE